MKKTIGGIILVALCCVVCLPGCRKVQPLGSQYPDGFIRSTPEAQKVHTEGIFRFFEGVEYYGLELHSFMFLRNGKVITEAWWYPYRPGIPHIMHSVSKTFTATAVGFAVDEKLLTVEDKVISFFPGDLPSKVPPYLKELSVKHLLTMTVGHAEPPAYNASDDNWEKRFLAEPIVNEPGTVFQYSTYATYMLSAIVQKVAGKTVFDYLTPRLFEPLGISDISWEVNKEGVNTGGWGLRIKTADLAKLGVFYLQKGKWNNRQLLSEGWFTEATSPQIYQQPQRTAEENAGDDWAQGYGYQLWICTNDAYRIDGAYGQFAVVIPEKDAVIAITARSTDTQRELKLIWENLIPMMDDNYVAVDPVQNDMLKSTLNSLQIPDPFRTVEDMAIPRNETRLYRMEPNALGLSAVTFRFLEDGACELTLAKENEPAYTFAFGQDAWTYGKTERLSPYFSSPRRSADGLPPFDVAGYSSWTAPDKFRLRLLYLNDIQSETYSCTFTKDQVSLEVTDTMDAQKAPVQLAGRRSNE